jgi:hypothetical protein
MEDCQANVKCIDYQYERHLERNQHGEAEHFRRLFALCSPRESYWWLLGSLQFSMNRCKHTSFNKVGARGGGHGLSPVD